MGLFYSRNGITGTLERTGDGCYTLNVFTENGEYILQRRGPAAEIAKKLKNLDHRRKTGRDLSEEEFKDIAAAFPLLKEYEIEVRGQLRDFTAKLLLYAIRTNDRELKDEVIRLSKLDPESLDRREIKEAVLSDTDQLPENDSMKVTLRGAFGGTFRGVWKKNSRYVFRGESWRRISPEMMEQLRQRFFELKCLQNDWQRPEEGFLSVSLPEVSTQVAFRKWNGSSSGKRKYEFLIVRNEMPVFTVMICDANDFLSSFDFETGIYGRAFHRCAGPIGEASSAGMRALRAAAKRGGDRYMELLAGSFLGEATEEDCEELACEDGRMHLVPKIGIRQAKELEIIRTRRVRPGFFARRKRYLCRVRVDGREGDILWYPEEPGHFRMCVFHHQEDCVLTEEQIRQFEHKILES